jgi:hypothetical protein
MTLIDVLRKLGRVLGVLLVLFGALSLVNGSAEHVTGWTVNDYGPATVHYAWDWTAAALFALAIAAGLALFLGLRKRPGAGLAHR